MRFKKLKKNRNIIIKMSNNSLEGMDILNYKELDLNNITYEDPVKIKGGSFMALAKYDGKPIYIQTPGLINNKGITKNEVRCNIELEFDKAHWPFYEFITNIDDHSIINIQKKAVQRL